MRDWLTRKKVYFDTVAVFVVSVAGLAVAVAGVVVAVKSNEAANKSVEVSGEELKLNRLQTAIAKASIKPHFTFKNDAYGNEEAPAIIVSHDGPEIRKLRGDCIAYLVIKSADGKHVNIELQDFYYQAHGGTSNGGSLSFYTYRPFVEGAITNFAVARLNGERETIERAVKLRDRPVEVRNFFRLTYYDLTGKLQTEFYDAYWPVDSIEPVAAKPQMREQIDVLPDESDNPAEAGATQLVAIVESLVAKHVAK